MRRRQSFLIATLLIAATGCGGGGGGSTELAPSAIWGQFRNNNQRTGAGIGTLQFKNVIADMEIVDEITPQRPFPSAISASPAIDFDGRIYIVSEGGTLASFEGPDDLNRLWSVDRCDRCPAGNQSLGRLVSSPAVYTFEDIDNVEQTSVFFGSMDDAVFLYRFDEDNPVVDPSKCDICFWRNDPALRQALVPSDSSAVVRAAFVSSPTFSANLGTGSIAGIFIGATITIEQSDGSVETQGKLYAINQDGSLRWEFPRAGEPPIGPITSSPVFSLGATIYFTTTSDPNSPGSGDVLYALTEAGNLKRTAFLPGLTDVSLPFVPSPMSSSTIFATGVDGTVHAINPDGTFRWSTMIEGQRLTSSWAIGSQNLPTETAGPEPTPTPTGTIFELTATPTATETPLRIDSNLLGISENGSLIVLDSRSGQIVSPTGQSSPAAVEGTVISSPALSSDLFLVFGTTGGQVFNINSANAQFPRFCAGGEDDGNLCSDNAGCLDGVCEESSWPILLPRSCNAGTRRSQLCSNDAECPDGACVRPAIRSSPAIDIDGTIYIGADDGRIYAIDELPTPDATEPPAASPTPTASAAMSATPTFEPSVTATEIPTATAEPTSTEIATPTDTAEASTATPTETVEELPSPSPTAEESATPTSEPTTEATATPTTELP